MKGKIMCPACLATAALWAAGATSLGGATAFAVRKLRAKKNHPLPQNKEGIDMKTANSYLNFNGNTEEAFEFYRAVFGGDFSAVVRFRDLSDVSVPEDDRDRIAHIALPLGQGDILMGSDVLESLGQRLTVGNNFSIAISAESAEEAADLFDALSEGGQVEMPLEETEWAERFGHCVDKFGIQWMIDYAGAKQFDGAANHSEGG